MEKKSKENQKLNYIKNFSSKLKQLKRWTRWNNGRSQQLLSVPLAVSSRKKPFQDDIHNVSFVLLCMTHHSSEISKCLDGMKVWNVGKSMDTVWSGHEYIFRTPLITYGRNDVSTYFQTVPRTFTTCTFGFHVDLLEIGHFSVRKPFRAERTYMFIRIYWQMFNAWVFSTLMKIEYFQLE